MQKTKKIVSTIKLLRVKKNKKSFKIMHINNAIKFMLIFKQKKCYYSNTIIFREIRKYQRIIDLLFVKLFFERLIKKIMQNIKFDLRIQREIIFLFFNFLYVVCVRCFAIIKHVVRIIYIS